jgi:calmodulin
MDTQEKAFGKRASKVGEVSKDEFVNNAAIEKTYGVNALSKTNSGIILPDVKKGNVQLTPEEAEWANTAKSIFKKYDANGDSLLSYDELGTLLGAISPEFSQNDVAALLKDADVNRDGMIQFDEFVDWLMRPASDSIGRAVVGYADCFKVLFDVYDKSGSGSVTAHDFMDCHVLMQAALRLYGTENDLHKADPLDLKLDHEQAFALVDKDGGGSISFLEFVDWMKGHIPKDMNPKACMAFTKNLADMLKDSFHHMQLREEDYINDDILAKKITELAGAASGLSKGLQVKKSKKKPQWSEPPTGLNVDRLKSSHMGFRPLRMERVREVHWECLCLPMPGDYEDAQARVWVAEVMRRVFWKDARKGCTVEEPEYYVYDRKTFSWRNTSGDSADNFDDMLEHLSPGVALFCLLKTAANFGTKIRWNEILLALEGAVDMKFLAQADVDKYTDYMIDFAFQTRKGEGLLDPDATKDTQVKRSEAWLYETLTVRPRVVMATLSDLKIVEVDPAWEDTEGTALAD